MKERKEEKKEKEYNKNLYLLFANIRSNSSRSGIRELEDEDAAEDASCDPLVEVMVEVTITLFLLPDEDEDEDEIGYEGVVMVILSATTLFRMCEDELR